MRAAAALVPGISTLVSWVWVVGGMLQSGATTWQKGTQQRGDSPTMERGRFLGRK